MSTEVILDIKKSPNKITFGTVVVTYIVDPFNPIASRKTTTDLHGRTLDTYLDGFCLGADYLVKINGELFEDDYTSYIVQPNDNIVYVSRVGKGGSSKQIITLVAMIALTVVSGGIGAVAMSGTFAGGLAGLSGMAYVGGLAIAGGIMMAGAMLINSVLASNVGSAGTISTPEIESSTYSWNGIQTSRDINTTIPVLYGTHALGGTVINNRFYYKGSDDWLAIQLALCHGEIEKIDEEDIKVQDAEFSTFIGNPVGSDGYFTYVPGKFDQPIMSGFSDTVYNNGSASGNLKKGPINFTTTSITGNGTVATANFATKTVEPYIAGDKVIISGAVPAAWNGTYTVISCTKSLFTFASTTTTSATTQGTVTYKDTFTFTTESSNIDFFRLHFEFPRGLYHMDSQGKKSSRSVTITAKYRKVGDTTWNSIYQTVPKYRTEYEYPDYTGDDGWSGRYYWSKATGLGWYRATRKVFEGYVTNPTIVFTNSSSIAYKTYFEPTTSDGHPITLPLGQYEFEIVRSTADDESTNVYNVSESHIRFLEEINTADINYGGVAMLGINIKATDQLSSQRPNFVTTVTRKPIYLNGAYRDSTNPAWVCYDILTNKQYGMGLNPAKINITEFNRWAAFCDGTLNNTFSISKPSTVVTNVNSYEGMLVIPYTEIPVGETLTLKNLNKNLSNFSGTGRIRVGRLAGHYVDTSLDINDITKITKVYEKNNPNRVDGYYYYISFNCNIKVGTTFLYTLVSKTKATELTPKLSFNGVFDTTSDVWTSIQEVARVGRGQVILQGTKYSCIYDTPKTVSGLYNAANSNNIVVSYLNRADIASELEIQYADKKIGYEMTSVSIQDADTMNSGVRSNKTSQMVKGITSEAEALVYGRYLLATSKYIRRVITLDADIESITQSVGDLIAVQTDVTQYGKGGLIKAAVGQIITLDDMIYLKVGSQYTLKIKRASDDFIKDYNFIATVTNPEGYLAFNSFPDTAVGVITFNDLSLVVHDIQGSVVSTNTLIIPEGYEIAKDDRYSFGLKGSDSILCIITDISRDGDLTRQITAAEYNESILDFNYDNDVLQRINPTLRPKNVLSKLKISDRLVKNETNTTVAMMSLTWDSTISSYYNMYIMEDDFKNYLVMGIKSNRYEYAAVELTPEVPYRIYIEDANDMGVITYKDYTITSFSSVPENITSFVVTPSGNSLDFNINYPNQPLDFSHYEVYLDNTLVSKQISNQFSLLAIPNKVSYVFKLIPIDTIGKKGNSITNTLNINAPVISSVTYTQEKEYIKFSINASSSNFGIDYYEFASPGIIGTSKDPVVSILADWVGTKTFTFKVYNVMGTSSIVTAASTVAVTITVPVPLNVTSSIDGKDAVLRWNSPTVGLPIEYYEVEYDGNIYKTKSNQYRLPIYWNGSKLFSIRAVSTLGAVSTSITTTVVISAGTMTLLKTEVIDNNVLLKWSSAQGSLPIENFMLYRGPNELSLEVIGEKKGTFTTIFENSAGVYTYWMAPVDSAGNIGAKLSATTMVNQPPDYVLNVDWYSTFEGKLVNARVEDNVLFMPINTTETIDNHFTSRGWTTAQAQITAGYPLWIEPFGASGSYTETFDYGGVLSSSMVSVNLDKTILKGTPTTITTISLGLDVGLPINTLSITGNGTTGTITYTPQASAPYTIGQDITVSGVTPIDWNKTYTVVSCNTTTVTFSSKNIGSATVQGQIHNIVYTDYINQEQVYGTGFRFIKVKIDVNGLNSALNLNTINVRLDSKLINDAGSSGVTDANAGKVVNFTKPFIDVISIQVTPSGTTPLFAIYDFNSSLPNPTQFTVYLYNTAGTRVTGNFSWGARGY